MNWRLDRIPVARLLTAMTAASRTGSGCQCLQQLQMHRDCLCQRRLAIPWGAAGEKLGDAVFARFCSSSFQSDVDMRVVRCLVFHTMAGLWQSSFSPHSDVEAAGPRIDVLACCQSRGPWSGVSRERALPVYIIFKNNKVRTDARIKPSTLETHFLTRGTLTFSALYSGHQDRA